jgi:hypothetical protein
MADIEFLPRVFVGQTRYGTKVYWDQRRGLLASYDFGADLVPIQADKLRSGFPVLWEAWVRLAALLPGGPSSNNPAARRTPEIAWRETQRSAEAPSGADVEAAGGEGLSRLPIIAWRGPELA